MPRPSWDNLPLGGAYATRLPDPGNWAGLALTPMTEGVPPDFALRQLESSALLAGHFLQDIAVTSGWVGSLGELDTLLDTAKRIAAAAMDADPLHLLGAVQDFLRSGILELPLAELQKLISQTLTTLAPAIEVIPYIGWAIAIIRGLVQAIKLLATPIVITVPEVWYPTIQGYNVADLRSVTFNAQRDSEQANRVLEILRGRDWTEIWMPRTGVWSALALDYNRNERVDGWYFGPSVSDAIAAIPGQAQMGAAFYGRAGWVSGSSEPEAWDVPVRSSSDMTPSANQLAALAWARMAAPTGVCLNVDFGALEDAWTEWQAQGSAFLDTPDLQPNANANVDLAADVEALRLMVRGALGSSRADSGRLLRTELYPGADGRRGSRANVASRVKDAISAQRARAWEILGTAACAYVPDDAPGLRAGRLRTRHRQMRERLLTSSSRHQVDLALVDGGGRTAYRSQIAAAAAIPGGGPPMPTSSRRIQLPEVAGQSSVDGAAAPGGGGALLALGIAATALGILWSRR
jgi:hypothetical protein